MRNPILYSLAAAMVLVAGPASADDLMTAAQEAFKPIPSIVPDVKGNAITDPAGPDRRDAAAYIEPGHKGREPSARPCCVASAK